MVAAQGRAWSGTPLQRQIVPAAWIANTGTRSFETDVSRVTYTMGTGYRNFFWQIGDDPNLLRMAGNLGQNTLIDIVSGTVVVQTGISIEPGADNVLLDLFYRMVAEHRKEM